MNKQDQQIADDLLSVLSDTERFAFHASTDTRVDCYLSACALEHQKHELLSNAIYSYTRIAEYMRNQTIKACELAFFTAISELQDLYVSEPTACEHILKLEIKAQIGEVEFTPDVFIDMRAHVGCCVPKELDKCAAMRQRLKKFACAELKAEYKRRKKSMTK